MKLAFILLLSFLCCYAYANRDAVLLTDIQALTFTRGSMSTARRGSPVPQLSCVGGSALNSKFQPTVVQCKNMGHDGYNVEWKCEADLDESVRFGPVTVSCEGYSSSSDPYVLRGSCGLEYTLEYTGKGEQQQNSHSSSDGYRYPQYDTYAQGSSSGIGSFLTFIVLVVAIFGLMSLCSQGQGQGYRNNYQAPVGGVGGVPGGYGAAPGGYGNGGYGGYGAPGAGTGYGLGLGGGLGGGYPSTGGGFWSGIAAGGLLSYLFRPRWGMGGGYGTGLGFGNTYGGYGGYGGYGNTFGGGYGSSYGGSSFGSSGFRSPSSSGTTTRSAAGYGGSRRR